MARRSPWSASPTRAQRATSPASTTRMRLTFGELPALGYARGWAGGWGPGELPLHSWQHAERGSLHTWSLQYPLCRDVFTRTSSRLVQSSQPSCQHLSTPLSLLAWDIPHPCAHYTRLNNSQGPREHLGAPGSWRAGGHRRFVGSGAGGSMTSQPSLLSSVVSPQGELPGAGHLL